MNYHTEWLRLTLHQKLSRRFPGEASRREQRRGLCFPTPSHVSRISPFLAIDTETTGPFS